MTNISILSRFHWIWVFTYVALFLGEILAILNTAYKLPSRLAPLGTADIALVTGGLDGLGLEIVKRLIFHHKVSRVYVLDVKEPVFEFDARVKFLKCDVGSAKELRLVLGQLTASLNSESKHISVLVNNAGVRHSGALLNTDEQDIRRIFSINTFAHITALKCVVSNHINKFRLQRLSLVTVSSILGSFGPRNLLVYSASKAAVTQIHECMAEELSMYPLIRMLLVSPGQLTTAMFNDVMPSRQFFAPIVNHTALAAAITDRVDRGETGVLCEPMYANFLPAVKTLPMLVQHWCRRFSQMDDKIKDE